MEISQDDDGDVRDSNGSSIERERPASCVLRRGEGAISKRDGERERERQRQKVSVLRPCGIRPPLRAHDSRKSLRLGIAPPRPPESTCRPLLRVGGRNWWRTRLERDYRLRPLLGANILLSLTGYIGVCVLRSAGRSGLWSTRGGFTLRLICSIILRRTSGNNRARVVNLRHDGKNVYLTVKTETRLAHSNLK